MKPPEELRLGCPEDIPPGNEGGKDSPAMLEPATSPLQNLEEKTEEILYTSISQFSPKR